MAQRVLNQSCNTEFSVSIPKPAIFMFTVQSAATERVAFYLNGSSKPVVFKDDQGTVMGNPMRGTLQPGSYKVKITANGRSTDIKTGQWDMDVNGQPKMTMVSAAVEDGTDNDYNDVFLQIFWWKYQN